MGLNVGFKKQSMITQLKDNSEFNSLSQNTLLDHGSSFGATAVAPKLLPWSNKVF